MINQGSPTHHPLRIWCIGIVFTLATCSFILMPRGLFAQQTAPAPTKTIEVILDSSGSMKSALPDGMAKIDAARTALTRLLESIPPETQIALRAYGHLFPAEKHNCRDMQLLVPFGSAGELKDKIIEQANLLKPLGYTPLTAALQMTAKDFPANSEGERTVILISDGKETCEGDPCAAARSLKKNHASVIIHTVGFCVDDVAKNQLECIATRTGGHYFAAADLEQLADVMSQAVQTPGVEVIEPAAGEGKLEIKKAELQGHKVTNAVSGKVAGTISRLHSTIDLPAGIYDVTFGTVLWKSVEVKADQTTVLEPGTIEIMHASLEGHLILDAETGVENNSASGLNPIATLLPGTYNVTFGSIIWPDIVVKSGLATVLQPGVIKLKGAKINGHIIHTVSGKAVGDVSATTNWMPLPPGDYTIEIGGKREPFTLVAGQDLIMENH